jgi:putative ABC transport system ATP-binding protein
MTTTEMKAEMKVETALQLQDVRFAYRPDRLILDIPALAISAGESVFIYGPSGSGKTTLLGLLAGVLKATSGSVLALGRDLSRMSSSERDHFRGSHVGYIFQMFNLIPYLTVEENIALPCRLDAERRQRLNGIPLHEAVQVVAARLGIESLLREGVVDLSVGQQQRVAAARSLIGTPQLVIADEPTSSLDYDHRERFVELLFENCRAAGSTLIFVSHDRTLMPHFGRSVSLPELNRV